MVYRALRAFNAIYPLAAFAFFVTAFFLALACTVIYPIVPLLLLIASIFLLVFVTVIWRILKGTELLLARRSLRHGRCPACAVPTVELHPQRSASEPRGSRLTCERCRRTYAANGDDWQPGPDDEDETADRDASGPEVRRGVASA